MSYCVNCGVELDNSLKQCPMCNTKVINPNALVVPGEGASPYPEKKGTVERVKRSDVTILITSILVAIAVTCGLLNWLVFPKAAWSLVVLGSCMLLWVILIPFMVYTKQSPYLSVLFDGIASLVYLALISQLTSNNEWLYGLGIPIVMVSIVVVELVLLCLRTLPRSFLGSALCIITGIGVENVLIECILDLYLHQNIQLGWSAIVLTVCSIIDIFLITVLSRRRLRNALRRRLHF